MGHALLLPLPGLVAAPFRPEASGQGRSERVAEIVCTECGYRVNILRTGPQSAKPEHDLAEFERLCRHGPFETLAATGCYSLDAAYIAASRKGEF